MWEVGSLHLLVGAPRVGYAHRMAVDPHVVELSTSSASCSRGAAINYTHTKRCEHRQSTLMANTWGECFTVVPTSLAQGSPANVFKDILEQAAVQSLEDKRGITLHDDQRRLLEKISTSNNSIISVPSLAGTGKTMLMTFMLELLLLPQ